MQAYSSKLSYKGVWKVRASVSFRLSDKGLYRCKGGRIGTHRDKNLVNKSQQRHWKGQRSPFTNSWAVKKLWAQLWRKPPGLCN